MVGGLPPMVAMRTLCWIPLLALALGCAALDGWAPPLVEARPELRPGPAADVSIDARDPGSGVLTVEMAIAGLPARRFAWRGSLDEVALSMPTFWGADGRRIAYERERDGFRLERPPGSVVRVRYRVRPGGPGRHGRQGVVTTEFASFDGRIFLLPVEAAGLRDVRIRVRTPGAGGWHRRSARTATSFGSVRSSRGTPWREAVSRSGPSSAPRVRSERRSTASSPTPSGVRRIACA